MTQQTERDEALIEHVRLNLKVGASFEEFAAEVLRLERSGWTPPAKPDRYLQVWKEAKAAYICPNRTEHESDQVAAAVLRKHFSLPSDVIEAAEWVGFHVQSWTPEPREKVKRLLDFLFILKGDQ